MKEREPAQWVSEESVPGRRTAITKVRQVLEQHRHPGAGVG